MTNNPEFDDLSDESKDSVLRFENYINNKEGGFFDLEQLLDILDYYVEIDNSQYFKEALDLGILLYPDDIDIRIRYSRYVVNNESYDKAIEYLLHYLELYPKNPDLLYSLGILYSEIGDRKSSVKYLKKSIEIDEDIEACQNLAQELALDNNFLESINYIEKVLKVEPDNDLALKTYSYCTQFIEKDQNTIDFLYKLCMNNPYSFNNWLSYGIVLSNFDEHFDAITAFDFCIAIDEKNAIPFNYKGESLIALDNIQGAIKVLHEALEIDPELSTIHFSLAQAYEKLDNWTTASSYYRECIKLDTLNADAWMGIGYCYFELDDFNSGEPFIIRALELDPDDVQNNITYAEMLYKEKKLSQSEEIFTTLYEQGQELDLVASNWALLLAEDNRIMDGVKIIQDTIDKHLFSDPYIYLILAEIGSKLPELNHYIMDILFDLFLSYDISIDIIKKYAPSVLEIPDFSELINTYININDKLD